MLADGTHGPRLRRCHRGGLAVQVHGLYPDRGAQGLPEESAALDQFLLAHPVGQEAEVPQPVEPRRGHVQQQAS